VRVQRGFSFKAGIDDQETECSLDSFNDWDKIIENDGDLEFLDKQLSELFAEYC
jgi:phosphomevalonate kinase